MASKSQSRAAHLTTTTGLRLQREHFAMHFGNSDSSTACAMFGCGVSGRVRVYNVVDWGWDETKQRSKGMHRKLLVGEMQPSSKTSMDIILQKGRLVELEFSGLALVGHALISSPLLARPMSLPSTAADFFTKLCGERTPLITRTSILSRVLLLHVMSWC